MAKKFENEPVNNGASMRNVDVLADQVFPWWKKTFIYMKKKEVATWKGALVLTFVTGVAVALIWGAKSDIYVTSEAAPATTLYFSPDSDTVDAGETFTLDAMVDPGSNTLVGADVSITYDESMFSLTNISCSGTFPVPFSRVIPSPQNGTAFISCANMETPYAGSAVAVATFTFQALSQSVSNSSIAFAADSNAADVNEAGNVILTMNPASVTIESGTTPPPTCTSFTYSDWGECIGGTQSRTIATSLPDGCVGGNPVLSQTCETPPPACTDYNYSAWGTCQSNNTWTRTVVSGIPTGCEGGANPVLTGTCDYSQLETVAPNVTTFTVTSTATSLTVTGITFAATDNVAVTGYRITETSSTPLANAAGWLATAPTSYTFTTAGSKTLYAWAKDAAGNVSQSVSRTVTITIPDTTAPTLTSFTVPATSASLTVPITTFSARDNIAVTGYRVTETSAAPTSGWTALAPSSYTFTSQGSKTLYAWARDAAGNVSASLYANVTISIPVDSSAPVISSPKPSGNLSDGTTQTTLGVTTSEAATCRYSTTAGVAYASMTNTFTVTGGTTHTSTITGLSDGKRYNYYVRCSDSGGNVNMADQLITFKVEEKDDDDHKDKKKKKTPKWYIKQNKSSIKRGQILIQRGKKFTKSGIVVLYFSKYGGGYYPPTNITADKNGKFVIKYRVAKPNGTYSWYAVDQKTGNKSKVRYYKVRN